MTIGDYRAEIRSAVYGFWRGAGDYEWFLDAMDSAISRQIPLAYYEGAAECGIAPDEITFEERMNIQRAILEQRMFIGGFADHIEQNTKALGGKRGPLYSRIDMWVARYNEVRERAKSKACADMKAVWVYGDTVEHCLPGNTIILTSEGEQRIDGMLPGNYVLTRSGWRVVKEVFSHEYDGPVVTVETSHRRLIVTDNHLIMTQRGWVEASKLIVGQDAVLLQDSLDGFDVHVAAPYSFDFVSTCRKIGVSCLVAPLLSLLAFCERIKARVTMPVIPVSFDNQLSDLNVNDEFVFDDDLSIIAYAEQIKNPAQLPFQPARMFSLVRAAGGSRNTSYFFRMRLTPSIQGFPVPGIVLDHPSSCSLSLPSPAFTFGETMTITGDYTLDRGKRAANNDSDFLRSMGRVKLTDAVNFFLGNCIPMPTFLEHLAMQLRSAFARAGLLTDRNSANIITDDVGFEHGATSGALNINKSSGFIAADYATESLCWWKSAAKRLVTVFTDKVSRFVRHCITSLYQPNTIITKSVENASLTVYNLEVEEMPEFFANGILVHNCRDCSNVVGRVYRISIWDKYGWIPGSKDLACGGWRCDCRREPTDAPVTKGRPPSVKG